VPAGQMVRLRPSVLAFIFVLKVLANSESGLLKVVFAVIALIVVPSTPVAILRYRLYDIERLIN
jgi:hypothetical protein